MKVLVYPAMMEIGGSQINAIELAHGTREQGHEVVVFGPDGALVSMVRRLGLEFIQSPVPHVFPSLANMTRLVDVVRRRGIDVVHGYEWGPSVELAFGPHLVCGVPLVTTVLSMSVPAEVPRHAPLLVGTEALVTAQRQKGWRDVELLEPPIDTDLNRPADTVAARARFGFRSGEVVASVVCRLTPELGKLQGVLDGIAAVAALAHRHPVRLLIAGTGPGEAEVARLADTANRAFGREVISFVGALLDPRDAYDCADIVLGMGSSALKGLAFGKPLIVHGDNGFVRRLDEETVGYFTRDGFHGDGGDGERDLLPLLETLVVDAGARQRLGAFGLRLVTERYSLKAAVRKQIGIYERVAGRRAATASRVQELVTPAIEIMKHKTVTSGRRLRSAFFTPRRAGTVPAGAGG